VNAAADRGTVLRTLPESRWRDRAILSAIAESLRAEHPCMGPLDARRLEAGLAEARALISRGTVDPHLLAAAYASGIVRSRPLRPGSAALALAAAVVALRLKGLGLTAPEAETVAVFRDLEEGAIGPAELRAWLSRACGSID
jgi:prophage maintenance system killer protein